LNKKQLHLVALTKDPLVRQIVEHLGELDHWRAEVFSETSRLVGAIAHDTTFLLLDEAAAVGGYVSLVKRIRKTAPAVDVIVVGGPKSEEVLASEKSEGIDQYQARPLDTTMFKAALRHRLKYVEVKTAGGIVGRSAAIEEIVESVIQVAPTEVPILIEGESGTGKDVVAKTIHLASRRSEKSFEAINCGAVAEGVLESELFGHEKGSFTGAVARRAGMFERAHLGTIFLDEVGEMSANMQVRLLRVLESGEILRVGGVETMWVDVRVIAATNRNLAEAVQNGTFRQDLYYRLKGVNLFLPPLRERREDIPMLVQHFIVASNKKHHKSVRGADPGAMRRLMSYTWPGNIRELKNVVDTSVVLTGEPRITAEQVDAQLTDRTGSQQADAGWAHAPQLPVALHRTRDEAEREMIYASILALHRDVREILALLTSGKGYSPIERMREVQTDTRGGDFPGNANLAQIERAAIKDALARFSGNRRKTADALGISERTLYRKIKEYGLV
jgi:DNA-binding NtrC family response regulator